MKIDIFNFALKPKPSIYCDLKSTSARKAFELENVALQEEQEGAAILWIRKGFMKLMPQLEANQHINHFPGESALINKGYLTQVLNAYDKVNPDESISSRDLYRESYRLYDPEDRKRFFEQLPAEDSKDRIWIYKPGNESRGRGIRIMWQMDELRKEYADHGDKPITDKAKQGIIQSYIHKPLLLNGRKSEMRVYWLIASIDPLRVLLFNEGTVSLNSLPYQLDDFDNQLIHVTNVYQQYKHPDYDPDVVLKWSFSRLNSYLYEQGKTDDPCFTDNVLMPKLKKYLAYVVKAGRDGFYKDYPNQGECFGVYGADVILDENLNPYISEIQKGPGLSFSDPIKKNVIPPMLGEAAKMMFELRQARIDGRQLADFKCRDRYEWMINEVDPTTCR
jgi:hypothetical protein